MPGALGPLHPTAQLPLHLTCSQLNPPAPPSLLLGVHVTDSAGSRRVLGARPGRGADSLSPFTRHGCSERPLPEEAWLSSPPSGQAFSCRSLRSAAHPAAGYHVTGSSGHTGCGLQPRKDRSLPLGQPIPLTVASSPACVAPALPQLYPSRSPLRPGPSPALRAPASACPLPGVVWLEFPLSQLWLQHPLLGEAVLPTTASPEPGKASENRAPVELAPVGPSEAPPRWGPLAHGASLSDDKKSKAPRAGPQRRAASQRHPPRNMSYQAFLALRCCRPFRCFLRLWRLSWKERSQ